MKRKDFNIFVNEINKNTIDVKKMISFLNYIKKHFGNCIINDCKLINNNNNNNGIIQFFVEYDNNKFIAQFEYGQNLISIFDLITLNEGV